MYTDYLEIMVVNYFLTRLFFKVGSSYSIACSTQTWMLSTINLSNTSVTFSFEGAEAKYTTQQLIRRPSYRFSLLIFKQQRVPYF